MILLDTHALIWWQALDSKLSARAAAAIEEARSVFVSAVSCWEVGMLVTKGRVALNRDLSQWVADMESEPAIELVSLSPRAGVTTAALVQDGFPGDPADGLLYATAVELHVPFVTADTRIERYARDGRIPCRIVW